MIASIDIASYTLGNKELFKDLKISLQANEKVAIIGRNGVGKTSLFRLLTGENKEYEGSVQWRRGTIVIATEQEHHAVGDITALEYVLERLPGYSDLKHIIDTYPDHMGSDERKITEFTDAIERFTDRGYFDAESTVLQTLADYQISEELAKQPLHQLSGGQKRFVELAKVARSEAHIALIDEPTNHMDYVGKARFIEWFKSTKEAVCVISHDRDVLSCVDRIIEIKDKAAVSFAGNYDAYLKQNSVTTITGMAQYEVAQRTIEKLHAQIQSVRAKKAGSSKTPNPFIPLERRLMKQYDELMANSAKPTFWVDQESANMMSDKLVEQYDKYKAKNIRIDSKTAAGNGRLLLTVRDLTIGYEQPLIIDIGTELRMGERLNLRGRNGAGKTTLVRTLLAAAGLGTSEATVYSGMMKYETSAKVGLYEQEIDQELLELTLGEAITEVLRDNDLPIDDQRVRRLLASYLFDPIADYNLPLSKLSGGQKARYQLIAMLAGEPNLLILDEPTNHLDLPSIEELEKALISYNGSILYISHDSYFCKKMGGEVLQIGPQ
jgi:ATP-binding cassette subfamily F protein 3